MSKTCINLIFGELTVTQHGNILDCSLKPQPMKTPKMKMPPYLSWRGVMTATNAGFRKMQKPLHHSFQMAVAVTNSSIHKMKTPLYLSLLGVVAVTGTSFKKKLNMANAA